jgi:hypothetical protein
LIFLAAVIEKGCKLQQPFRGVNSCQLVHPLKHKKFTFFTRQLEARGEDSRSTSYLGFQIIECLLLTAFILLDCVRNFTDWTFTKNFLCNFYFKKWPWCIGRKYILVPFSRRLATLPLGNYRVGVLSSPFDLCAVASFMYKHGMYNIFSAQRCS